MVTALDNKCHSLPISRDSQSPKDSDKWYTPPQIVTPVVQVLDKIDLDPCADDGRHIPATTHYTASDDGLTKEWHGKVFMNPPYSCPSKWIAKLQEEVDAGRVTEAIALVPASTDTNWLHPYLAHQPLCFWKGRIKFLDTNYKQKDAGRQSHCLLYWGDRPSKFKEVFDPFGTVQNVNQFFSEGQQVQIISGKHQGKTAVVKGFSSGESQVCCWVEDSFYFHYYPESLHVIEAEDLPLVSPPSTPIQPLQPANTMTFHFPQTQELAAQIAQLQAQLNQLTATLHPYKECEQKAGDLLQQVGGLAQEMREKGVEGRSLLDWASKLYFAVTGEVIEKAEQHPDTELIAKIESLETELKESKSKGDKLAKRIELLDRDNRAFLERIRQLESQPEETQEFKVGDRVTTEIGEEGEVTGFVYGNVVVKVTNGEFQFQPKQLTKQEPTEFKVGDIVQREDGQVGTIDYIPTPFNGILSASFSKESFSYHADKLKLISRPQKEEAPTNPEAEAQLRGQQFIAGIKNKNDLEAIAWEQIQQTCQGSVSVLREIFLSAKTKTQKTFVENIPQLLANHIEVTGDRSPLDWVGDTLKSKVEALLTVTNYQWV